MIRARHRGASALVVLWAVVCLGGLALLWRYKTRPGDPGDPPSRWPAAAGLARAEQRATLVMTVHPHCACTRASLAELGRLMQRAPAGVAAYILFVAPDGVAAGWENGEHWDRAHHMPGVEVVLDRGGVLAEQVFRLKVSGHVLVYDAAGALRFSGGITGARGHEGDNIGETRVAALLSDHAADADSSHVFGCALEESP
jgi:hypothetical protein